MRVTDVERVVVHVPFTERARPWYEMKNDQWGVVEVIRLTTDSGIVGYGETLPYYTWGRVPDEAIDAVRGANPADFLGRDDLGCGLQMAIYDAVGKVLEVPMHRLLPLPQVRDRCPLSWWSTKMPPETLAAEAQDAVAAGYLSHKFKARPWFDIYEQVEAVSAVTPTDYLLDLDWNQMLLDVGTAAPVLQRLDTYERVDIYETPIRQRDLAGYRRLRDKTNRPIADHFTEARFTEGLRAEAHDGYVVSGGVSSVLKQGALASTFNRPHWLQLVGTGITTAFAVQLGAALPDARWPYVTCLNIYTDDLLVDPLVVRTGHIDVPTAPGLGVEVDEATLTKLALPEPHRVDYPDKIYTVRWPSGHARHYATVDSLWQDALDGNVPAQEPGARMDIWTDDDSTDFADLRSHALLAPVSSYQG